MTADPGSEAGAAGISAEQRVKAAHPLHVQLSMDPESAGEWMVSDTDAIRIAEEHAAAAVVEERRRLRGTGGKWADAVDEMAAFLERECPSAVNATKRMRAAALAFGVQRGGMEDAEAKAAAATARAEKYRATIARVIDVCGLYPETPFETCATLLAKIRAALAKPARREGENE